MGATQYAFSTILLFVLNLKVGVCLSFCNFMNEKRGWEGWMGGGEYKLDYLETATDNQFEGRCHTFRSKKILLLVGIEPPCSNTGDFPRGYCF